MDSPTCYRHPDRPAAVGCQRCDRPICPQCMVQAAVGFQCPECLAAAPQRVVPARAAFAQPPAPLTRVLIGANVAVFALGALLGGGVFGSGGRVFEWGALFGPYVANGEWYRLVSSAFLHSGVLHLGSNMLLLYLLGSTAERMFGSVGYGALYVAGLFGGAVGALLLDPRAATVGASGAVFGLMAGYATAQYRSGQNPWGTGMGGLIAVNLLWTFLVPGISVGGHVGGLVAGAVAGWILLGEPREPASRRMARTAIVVVMCLGLGAVGVWRARADLVGEFGLPAGIGVQVPTAPSAAASAIRDGSRDDGLESAQIAAPDQPQDRSGQE